MKSFDAKSYWEARLREYDGLTGVGYARLGRSYNLWMYRVRRHVFRKNIQALRLNTSQIRVLDIGSGTGFYIEQWQALGVQQITGLDLTHTAVHKLRQKYPQHDFHEQNIGAENALDVLGQTFDVISMFDVVFHIVEEREFQTAIYNLYQLLNPGGILIFSDFFLHKTSQPADDRLHVKQRLLADIESKVRLTGFEIVKRAPLFVLMNQPVDGNWLAKWMWRALSGLIGLHDLVGLIIGSVLYPIEIGLVGILRESATTEIMICRKPTSGANPPT